MTRGTINDLGQALQEGIEDLTAQTRSYQPLAKQTGDGASPDTDLQALVAPAGEAIESA